MSPQTIAFRSILMDYPNRRRLKILAHMEARELGAAPDLAARLDLPGYKGKPERAFLLHLETFDWNCPQHITPRFTAAEIENAVSPLRSRIAALEASAAAFPGAVYRRPSLLCRHRASPCWVRCRSSGRAAGN